MPISATNTTRRHSPACSVTQGRELGDGWIYFFRSPHQKQPHNKSRKSGSTQAPTITPIKYKSVCLCRGNWWWGGGHIPMLVVTHHAWKKNDGPLLKVGSHPPISTLIREVPSTVPNQESNLDPRFNTIILQALSHQRNKAPGKNVKHPNRRDYAQSVQTTRHYVKYAGHHPGVTLRHSDTG